MKTFKITFVTTILAAAVAFGADAKTKAATPAANGPSKEKREEMAATHEKLAACLRTDAPMETCHEIMKAAHEGKMCDGNCPMMAAHKGEMGDESCPMAGKHKGSKKMKMHHEMMEKEGSEDKK